MKTYTVEEVLVALNLAKVRATYGAVAYVLRMDAQKVGAALGERRPEASWVVNSSTDMPTGYSPSQLHPQLQTRDTILRSGPALIELLESTTPSAGRD